jgi:hypothetical protein
MARSNVFLNYTAFLILYLTAIIVLFYDNTVIIGYYFIFVVTCACTLYNMSYLTSIEGMDLVPQIITFSIIVSGIFHSISLIFVIMMISNMRVKYSNTYGTPIQLPPKYQLQLDMFKNLMISTFSICFLLLLWFALYYDILNKPNIAYTKSIGNIVANPFPYFVLLVSCAPLIMSSINLAITNDFTKLSRKDLMK